MTDSHRILVVDDEPIIHELVRELISDVTVLSASSLAEARKIAEATLDLEVALVDKNLPDGSGLDFVRWLRRTMPECETIIITGFPSMNSAREAIALGASDYLVKPLRDINELRARVDHARLRVKSRRNERYLLGELRASEERYRGLFAATADPVLVIDTATRTLLDANPAAERVYGRSRAELLALRASDLTDPATTAQTSGGVIVRRDLRADGTSFPVEVTCGAMTHERELAIEVVRDVSERERAAAERAELESRLAHAAKLEALGRLAAGVAHDFNNVLCVVLNACEFAADSIASNEPDAARDELAQIHEAVASGIALTRQLLLFGRPHAGRRVVVDLNARMTAVATMLKRTLPPTVAFELALSPSPISILIDPGQLEQVVANLVVNARDALGTRAGTIALSSSLCAGPTGAAGVRVVIADDGPGMPPAVLARVFEPYFTTKGDRGTGLGLANVQEIAQRANGTVEIESAVGAGTRVVLWLPLAETVADAEIATKPAAEARGAETVLVIEDDAGVRDHARRLLEDAGYAVHAVRDGESAVSLVAGGARIDIVVADVQLPGISGIDCVTRIGNHNPKIKALFTSASPIDAAGDRFLAKPYGPTELLRHVRAVLDVVQP
jgi:two-component system cell cycle sensor histidine kinase/response regulator CckA